MVIGSGRSAGGVDERRSWTPEQQQRWRSDTRLRLALLLGAGLMVVAGMVIGFGLAVRDHPGRPVDWTVILGVGLGTLALLALCGFVGLRLRARSAGLRALVVSADRKDRARVAKVMRQGKDVSPQDREVALAVIAQVRSSRWVTWLLTGLCALQLGLSVTLLFDPSSSSRHNGFMLALRFATMALFVFLAGSLWWARRRILAWADRYPTDNDEVSSTP